MALEVIATIAALRNEGGGMSRSIPALYASLQKIGVGTHLLTTSYTQDQAEKNLAMGVPLTIAAAAKPPFLNFCYAPEFKRILKELIKDAKGDVVVHDHGVWRYTDHVAAALTRKYRIPFIASPRGALTKWSFQYRAYKKLPAWFMYQKRDFCSAQLLHVTSENEAEDLKALGVRRPMAIIPNGTFVPATIERNESQVKFRTALFLSRIHPKKGLLNLVKAWASVMPADWRVIIAGPDELRHSEQVRKLAAELGVLDAFSFVGEVYGERKDRLYRSADLFILPTFSENFGIFVSTVTVCPRCCNPSARS